MRGEDSSGWNRVAGSSSYSMVLAMIAAAVYVYVTRQHLAYRKSFGRKLHFNVGRPINSTKRNWIFISQKFAVKSE